VSVVYEGESHFLYLAELGDPGRHGRNLRTARACLSLIERSKESSEKNAAVPYREN
jgi:hypothetical protein